MLEKLSEVQTRDLSLDVFEGEKLKVPQALIELQAETEALGRKLADRRDKYQDVAKQVRASELEMGALSERRKRQQPQP
jgi:predicted  nucleic acid-binding Zn-ribbon protein